MASAAAKIRLSVYPLLYPLPIFPRTRAMCRSTMATLCGEPYLRANSNAC